MIKKYFGAITSRNRKTLMPQLLFIKTKKSKQAILFALILFACFFKSVSQYSPARAETSNEVSLSQQDLDGDGDPDVAVLISSLVTENDVIYVFEGRDDMQWGDAWESITDFTDDTWIFDIEGDDSAQLIIQFYTEENVAGAKVYSDLDSDGIVAYEVRGSSVIVRESIKPPLVVLADGDWYLADGQLNWNVKFLTDGPSVKHIHTYELSEPWLDYMVLDGGPDAILEFHDANLDGIPEYGMWRLLSITPPITSPTGKTFIWANSSNHRPIQPKEDFFWPYLMDPADEQLRYFEAPPFIKMDWLRATITQVSFRGYPIEHGFHVNTWEPFKLGEANYANFENMQAYYDLAEDNDRIPELHIRHEYFNAHDAIIPLGVPTNMIRYSWNQFSPDYLRWDYKLDLGGRYELESTVDFPDFSFYSIPHAEFPSWIMENEWDFATFVAHENGGFSSTEGIYEWSVLMDWPMDFRQYLEGTLVLDLFEKYENIPLSVGMRGEVAPDLDASPYLYMSSVDRKVHIFGGKFGRWNIDGENRMLYLDLDGDSYFDQWQHVRSEQVVQQVNLTANYLIYSGNNQVVIKPSNSPPALFKVQPPHDHQTWVALGDQISAYEAEYEPGDLLPMLQAFGGAEVNITGASFRDLRLVGRNGFRFILTLRSGFSIEGQDIMGIANLPAGSYAIAYDGVFTAQPLTPPSISLSIQFPDDEPVTNDAPLLFRVLIINSGLEDTNGLTLAVSVRGDNQSLELFREKVNALSGDPIQKIISWQPTSPAAFEIAAWLENEDGTVVSGAVLLVEARAGGADKFINVLSFSSGNGWRAPAVFVLILLSVVSGWIFWQNRLVQTSGDES